MWRRRRNADVTGSGAAVAQAKEGASTEMAGTAAADADLLHLPDRCDLRGPRVKGEHLKDAGNETKKSTDEGRRQTGVQVLELPSVRAERDGQKNIFRVDLHSGL